MICTFAGHREILGFNQAHLMEILESILESEQERICYVGGMGEFDSLCANAVRVLKHRHPEKNFTDPGSPLVVEEFLYRGILFGSFSSTISYPKAIVFSAAFFLFRPNKVSWPAVFVVGILLAWIYWRTDNLAVTMVIHGAINLGTFLSMPLYALLTTNQTLGIMAGLLMVLLGIGITYLSIKMFLQKHDALPA